MNKDDFDRFWTSCVPREARNSNENIFDDVIKAIDNAKKYKHLTESKLLEQYRERGQKIHELFQLKKRMKKRIDTYPTMDCRESDCVNCLVRKELVKIMEVKNEIN